MLVRLVAVRPTSPSAGDDGCHTGRKDGWISGLEYPEVEVEKTEYWVELMLYVGGQI